MTETHGFEKTRGGRSSFLTESGKTEDEDAVLVKGAVPSFIHA